MYCPKCGAQNDQGAKFCRGCGENLKVISQAMSKRLPIILASKMDAYLERKNERIRRDSVLAALNGCVFLFLGIRQLLSGAGGLSFGGSWFPILFGCFMLLHGLWDHMVYKRSLTSELGATRRTAPGPHHSSHFLLTPPSITESTTHHLDTANGR